MLATPQLAKITMATMEAEFYELPGLRIAERRKAVGITQVQLTAIPGIAQQNMAQYEAGKFRISAELLPVLAETLDLSIEGLIRLEAKGTKGAAKKRGPAPKIQQQPEHLSALPKAQQRVVSEALDSMLAQAGR